MNNRLEEIEGIPSGLVTCFYNQMSIEILALSPQSITVRVPDSLCADQLRVCFYHFDKNEYESIEITVTQLEHIHETFYEIYDYQVANQVAYSEQVRTITKNYYQYTLAKMSGDDSILSAEMVDYPAHKDMKFAKNYEEQLKKWLHSSDWKKVFELISTGQCSTELAICISSPVVYSHFIQYGKQSIVPQIMQEDKRLIDWCNRVYIGNQFCHNLFPESHVLWKMMDKAREEKLAITLMFAYLRDDQINHMSILLEEIYQWCKENHEVIEVICNDFGMLTLLQGKVAILQPVLGVLLNKRRKDPRYQYKKGFFHKQEMMQQNAWNSDTMRRFSKQYHIKRFEYESCGYQMEIAPGKHSLEVPLYQTNTAQFCPLYAVVKNGERGKQNVVNKCTYECGRYALGYPEHLKMIGLGNSIFAYDDSLCNHMEWMQQYLEHGIDRIVWNA